MSYSLLRVSQHEFSAANHLSRLCARKKFAVKSRRYHRNVILAAAIAGQRNHLFAAIPWAGRLFDDLMQLDQWIGVVDGLLVQSRVSAIAGERGADNACGSGTITIDLHSRRR